MKSLHTWGLSPRQNGSFHKFQLVSWLNGGVSTSNLPKKAEPRKSGSKFRQDILGLRGVAVLLVVFNHFALPGFSGGFLGVDLFFVISGYLIVGLMYQEYTRNGRSLGGYGWISVSSFFERRIRRIFPSAFFVLSVVYFATFLLRDAAAKLQITRDIIWAFLFASNINFAQRQTDYFTKDSIPSPVLHYWSLAVEEQFYILMPFIFMAVVNWHGFSLAGRRFAARYRLYFFISLISIASYAYMVLVFTQNKDQVYFSLFSRIWEFGIGALAAITLPVVSLKLKIFLYLLRRMSYLGLILSLLIVKPDNFGYTLVLPTFSIAIILYVNNQIRGGAGYDIFLSNKVLAFFGRISFSLYLWHWPCIIFAEYLQFSLSWSLKIGIFIVVTALAAMTERYIERPFLRVGYMNEFHVSPMLKSRRITASILALISALLVFATYQPVISTQLTKIQVQKERAFWSPPNTSSGQIAPSSPLPETSPKTPAARKSKPVYLGIFGDSTNQCCSATGAFWPRLVANKYGWRYVDYSKPATSYLNDGVGSNGCVKSTNCPSVLGQLAQAKNKVFDVITISAGIGECTSAKNQPQSLKESLIGLFGDFRKNFPDAQIVALGLVSPNLPDRKECISSVNPIVAEAAKASGINFLNDSNWITNPKVQMTTDASHLNDSGHQVFAKNFAKWMASQKSFAQIIGY